MHQVLQRCCFVLAAVPPFQFFWEEIKKTSEKRPYLSSQEKREQKHLKVRGKNSDGRESLLCILHIHTLHSSLYMAIWICSLVNGRSPYFFFSCSPASFSLYPVIFFTFQQPREKKCHRHHLPYQLEAYQNTPYHIIRLSLFFAYLIHLLYVLRQCVV